MDDLSDDAVAVRRHTIPDHLYIAEHPDTMGRAFIDLADSIAPNGAARAWFHRRVADSIQHIRDDQALAAAQRDGTVFPSSEEISGSHQQAARARKEIFDALQDLLVVSCYLRRREGTK